MSKQPKSSVVDNIKKMEEQRAQRREKFEELKQEKANAKEKALAAGKVCDYDFDQMINE